MMPKAVLRIYDSRRHLPDPTGPRKTFDLRPSAASAEAKASLPGVLKLGSSTVAVPDSPRNGNCSVFGM